MFAPYCRSCASRVLLGPRRIVSFDRGAAQRQVVVLRCFCGALLDWDTQPPAGADRGRTPRSDTGHLRLRAPTGRR